MKCVRAWCLVVALGLSIPVSALSIFDQPGSTILYVGGSGPGNYTTIQAALNASADGDTVFVFHGIYREHLMISTAVRLLGEGKYATIIDYGATYDNLTQVNSNHVTISGFTLRTTGNWTNSNWTTMLIRVNWMPYPLYYNNITITDNVFSSNYSAGIFLSSCSHCLIENNSFFINHSSSINLFDCDNFTIQNNAVTKGSFYLDWVYDSRILNNTIDVSGILLYCCSSNEISHNTLTRDGIELTNCHLNHISHNTFFGIYYPMRLYDCSRTTIEFNAFFNTNTTPIQITNGINLENSWEINISGNCIRDCIFGLFIKDSFLLKITKNTFQGNRVDARFYNSHATWNQNYWERPHRLPKPIFGVTSINNVWPGFFQFDRHPAKAPYQIK